MSCTIYKSRRSVSPPRNKYKSDTSRRRNARKPMNGQTFVFFFSALDPRDSTEDRQRRVCLTYAGATHWCGRVTVGSVIGPNAWPILTRSAPTAVYNIKGSRTDSRGGDAFRRSWSVFFAFCKPSKKKKMGKKWSAVKIKT